MLSQGIPGGDVNLRGEIPQGFDLQQLISQLDPATLPANNPLRGLYLSQIPNIAAGSPSPNSQPPSSGGSSAAPEPSPTPAGNDMSGLPNWFQTLLPQQSQQQAQQTQNNLNVNQLFEQMAMNSLNFNLMGGNMNAIAAALGQGNGLMGHSNGQPQNKDAYCELCDKEFCNRYFLKTHRQKKHGIAMDQSPTKSTPTMPTSPQHGMSMQFGGSGGAFPFNLAPSTSTASQPSVIVNGSDEREIATPPLKKIKSEEDEEKAMKASIDNLILASMNGGSASCDECGQTFATIFAVMTHKAKEHSGNTNESSPAVYKCSECDKEFDSSIYLEKHQIIQHGGGAAQKILGLIPPNFPFVLPTGMQQHFSMPDFENGLAGMNTPKQNGVKRQYSSNGKNYCDLCNKEVCNKYFLRTHMLKMHGIVIDENKTVIANIDTVEKERMGTLSFRCDICMTELKSRNLLRSHKQEVHGVMPITASSRKSVNSNTMVPTSPSIEEKCPVCDRRMSLSALTVHIQTEHAGELNGMIPQLESRFQCKYCPSRFNDEMEYQMHNIQHTVVDLIKSQEQKASDPSVLQCSMCQYTTYDPHNLEMHIDRHERMNDAKSSEEPEDEALKMTTEAALKMVVANKFDIDRYKCHQCDIPYADAASLDAHNAVAHLSALNLTVPKEIKKDAADDKVVERNSHTSGSLSPSGDTLPEGFGKVPDSEKPYLLQTFVLRTSDSHGNFLDEIIAHLPVKSLLAEPTHVTFELVPSPMPSSYQ